jgi:hypothetical protein
MNRREMLKQTGAVLGSLMLIGVGTEKEKKKEYLEYTAEEFNINLNWWNGDEAYVGIIAICEIETWDGEKFACEWADNEVVSNFFINYSAKNEERLMKEGRRSLVKSINVNWESVEKWESGEGRCCTTESAMYFNGIGM